MLLGWCVVAIDFPSFMELRFIDMKEKWLLTSSLLARERNERLSKTSKAELDGAISILASLPRSTPKRQQLELPSHSLILHIPHTFTFFLLKVA